MAAGPGSGPGAPSEAEAAHLCRSLEVGTVMTLFYSKKSQRPERKTFQVKLETRQVTWSRGSEKIEGAGECRGGGGGGTGAAGEPGQEGEEKGSGSLGAMGAGRPRPQPSRGAAVRRLGKRREPRWGGGRF